MGVVCIFSHTLIESMVLTSDVVACKKMYSMCKRKRTLSFLLYFSLLLPVLRHMYDFATFSVLRYYLKCIRFYVPHDNG